MKTFTFYSYKGGTGRSLLLANAARYLAFLGKRVVAVDFDFEAPGLHYKLNISPPGKRTADAIPKRGAVDYLLAASEGDKPPKSLLDYVVPVPLPRDTEGSLHLMPAGSAPTGDYWKALTALLRQDPFTDPEGSGIAACLELKARIEEELRADFLLIDSRTGVTELAGVTTTVLADKVVCLMLANLESQTGARAVLRSLRHAPRLPGQPPIEIIPVLSRVPDRDETTVREALSFLNEPGPTPEDTLALKRVFVLRTDPDLARGKKLHVGSDESQSQSSLHQDYLALLTELVEADPARAAAAFRRQEAIRDARRWLIDGYGRVAPEGFREEQIDEGVQFKEGQLGSQETPYADLVAYAEEDRTEALLAVEYVEDLAASDAWKWWQEKTRLRCVMLIGKNERGPTKKRVFTRGGRGGEFVEYDDWNGWAVQIGVLIVDHHLVVRKGVHALLMDADDITVVGEAGDGLEAVAEARRLRPQVILMDLKLPHLDGVEATRAILAEQPDMGVVVLTGTEGDEQVLAAVEAGALGYLAKASKREDFLLAIRQVARGELWLSPRLTRKLLTHLKPRPAAQSGAPLTDREARVLNLLARGRSNQQISVELNITEVTVRTHVSHIMEKLGVTNRVEAALHALRAGVATLEGEPGSHQRDVEPPPDA